MDSLEPDEGLIVVARPGDQGQTNRRAFQKRRRSRACDACRRRKTKCDTPNAGACSSCISASLLCVFSEDAEDRRRLGPARRMRQLETTVRDLSDKLRETEAKLGEVTGEPQRSTIALIQRDPSSGVDHSRSPESPKSSSTFLTPINISQTSNMFDRRGSVPSNYVGERADGPSQYAGDSRTPSMHEIAPGITFISSLSKYFETIHNTFGGSASGVEPDFWNTVVDIDYTPIPPTPAYAQPQDPKIFDLRQLLPPIAIGDKLLDNLERNFLRYMPIFYWPIILRKYKTAYDFPILVSEHTTLTAKFCLVSMLFAVSCAITSEDEIAGAALHSKRGWVFYEHARTYHDVNKAKYDMDDICVLLLMTIYLDICALPSPSWMTCGSLCRVCQDVYLYDHKVRSLSSIHEIEHYNRMFWGAYLYDRKLAARFGRPPLIKDSDIDVELPGGFSLEGASSVQHISSLDTAVPSCIMIMRSCIENAKIYELILDFDVQPGSEKDCRQRMDKIDGYMANIIRFYPNHALDHNNDSPMTIGLFKAAILPLISRMCLFRFYLKLQLGHDFREMCLTRSVAIGRHTTHVLYRLMQTKTWQEDFQGGLSDLINNHIFRVAVSLILHQRLNSRAEVNSTTAREVEICMVALQQAAIIDPQVSKNLEILVKIGDASLELYQPGNKMELFQGRAPTQIAQPLSEVVDRLTISTSFPERNMILGRGNMTQPNSEAQNQAQNMTLNTKLSRNMNSFHPRGNADNGNFQRWNMANYDNAVVCPLPSSYGTTANATNLDLAWSDSPMTLDWNANDYHNHLLYRSSSSRKE